MAFQRRKPAAVGAKPPYPGFVEPALASSVDKVPSGKRWIHEIKFDGYRVQLHIHNEDDPKVFTRRGNNWTKRFKKIADDAFLINAGTAIIDGEVVVPGVVSKVRDSRYTSGRGNDWVRPGDLLAPSTAGLLRRPNVAPSEPRR